MLFSRENSCHWRRTEEEQSGDGGQGERERESDVKKELSMKNKLVISQCTKS